jgi:hypothetical protein
MDLQGTVLYDDVIHYRFFFNGYDYLLPWQLDRDPTYEELIQAVNGYYNYNSLNVKCFKV